MQGKGCADGNSQTGNSQREAGPVKKVDISRASLRGNLHFHFHQVLSPVCLQHSQFHIYQYTFYSDAHFC